MNRHTKILMMSLVNPGRSEGGFLHQMSLAVQFINAGQEVSLVIPGRTDSSEDLKLPGGTLIRTVSVEKAGLPLSLNTLLQVMALLRLRLFLEYEVLYIRANLFSLVPVLLARLLGMKVVLEHNGWMASERIARGGNHMVARIERSMQVLAARMAHHNRCVTRGLKLLLTGSGIDHASISVIGNGTDIAAFYPIERAEALGRLDWDPAPIRIGFIGGLVRWQGLETAIRAYALLPDRAGTRLVIAGNGPEYTRLINLARQLGVADQTDFPGTIDRQDANLVINAFDIAIAPFSVERNMEIGLSPIKIRDYAAAGRFVVCSDIPEVLEHRESPWIRFHKPDDPADLCRLLQIALTERPYLDKAILAAARGYAITYFDWRVIAAKVLELIHDR